MANSVLGETETSDNILNYDFVRVSIKGDINADYVVNIIDISKAAAAFESSPTHARWDPNCDINEDRKINIIDISAIAKEFGKQFWTTSNISSSIESTHYEYWRSVDQRAN
jgi:hypothetical protein